MVFLPTAHQAGFAAEVLSKDLEPIYEIHSRLSQSKWTNVADAFAKAKKGAAAMREGWIFLGTVHHSFLHFLDIPLTITLP